MQDCYTNYASLVMSGLNRAVIETIILIDVQIKDNFKYCPLHKFCMAPYGTRIHHNLKILRLKGYIREEYFLMFLELIFRNYFPVLEYCSLHTLEPTHEFPVHRAIQTMLNNKINGGQLRW